MSDRERTDASTAPPRPPGNDEAFLALGANQGERLAALRGAVQALGHHAAIQSVRPSPLYESEAHTRRPGAEQPAYLNAVMQLQTTLAPGALLELAWQLETQAGRDREAEAGRWAPRPLDVDLLVVGPAVRRTNRLRLPHPRLGERRFVLRPWVDLVPNLRVPSPFGETTSALLARCRDRAALRRTDWRLC